jgi:hypothetical protein
VGAHEAEEVKKFPEFVLPTLGQLTDMHLREAFE